MGNFILSPEQDMEISEWRNNHDCTQEDVGVIGGRITFCFTPTGLGVVKVIKCACGQRLDVTEYEEW